MKFWFLIVVGLMVITGQLPADTILLKNGTHLEGEIIGETAQDITIEVEVAKGILSTKTVPKSDITEVTHPTPEQKTAIALARDYAALQKYALVPDTTLTAAQYDRVIDGVFKKFLTDYPGNEHEPQVQEHIKQWQAERAQVVAGMVKTNGEWQTKDEAERPIRDAKIRELIEIGEKAFTTRQWPRAANVYNEILNLQPSSAAALGAKRQLIICLTEWRKDLEQQQSAIAGKLAAAQRRYDQAQQAAHQKPTGLKKSTDTKDGGKMSLSESGDSFMKAQTELNAAKNQLAPLQTQATTISRQLDDVNRRYSASDLQEVIQSTQTVATASNPAPNAPTGTSDVLEDTANWWQRNWVMLAVVAVIGVYLLSRITGK